MAIVFQKMQGCGNDFLFVDAMKGTPPKLTAEDARYWCDRHFGIGADGIAVLSPGKSSNARWDFFNSDGSRAEMCGNAARCAIRLLSERHFPSEPSLTLETLSGVIRGRRHDGNRVEISMPIDGKALYYDEKALRIDDFTFDLFCVNTGVPHAVLEVNDIRTYPISKVGRMVQAHPAFQPEGTNVTYFQRVAGKEILSTTFERGVEAETFACGTGAAAAAIVFSERYAVRFPVDVVVPGGRLQVEKDADGRILLLGPAEYVFQVEVEPPRETAAAPSLYGRKG